MTTPCINWTQKRTLGTRLYYYCVYRIPGITGPCITFYMGAVEKHASFSPSYSSRVIRRMTWCCAHSPFYISFIAINYTFALTDSQEWPLTAASHCWSIQTDPSMELQHAIALLSYLIMLPMVTAANHFFMKSTLPGMTICVYRNHPVQSTFLLTNYPPNELTKRIPIPCLLLRHFYIHA